MEAVHRPPPANQPQIEMINPLGKTFKYDPFDDIEFGNHFCSSGYDKYDVPRKRYDAELIKFAEVKGGDAELVALYALCWRFNLKFALEALDLVLGGDMSVVAKEDLKKPQKIPKKKTNADMGIHLDNCCDTWNILEPVEGSSDKNWKPPTEWATDPVEIYLQIEAWCVFFPVAKKDDSFRAIFDSRGAGSLCRRPGPVNFSPMSILVQALAKYGFHWTADLKHWFYQIPIHERLRNLFKVRAEGINMQTYRMKVLPQGWSWSPRIAQCIGWAIILYMDATDKDMKIDMEAIRGRVDPPPHVTLLDKKGDKAGQVFLWIDNILVAGHDRKRVYDLAKRIYKSAKLLKVTFSEPDFGSGTAEEVDLACNPDTSVEYVGVVSNPGRKGGSRVWRHTAKKYKKLEELKTILEEGRITPRVVQCVTGNAIWNSIVALRPLYTVYHAIALSQLLIYAQTKSKDPKTPNRKVDWDLEIENLSDLEREELIDIVNGILHSKDHPYTMNSCDTEFLDGLEQTALKRKLFCTDASDLLGGYVDFDETSLRKCEAVVLDFTEEQLSWDINLKELWVAVQVIKKYGSSSHQLVLGIDSAVARSWLRRKLASGESAEIANTILADIPRSYKYTTLFLYSEDNLADNPTRNKSIYDAYPRYQATKQILTGSHLYLNTVSDLVPEGTHKLTKISIEQLSDVERDRVQERWTRWTCEGLDVGNDDGYVKDIADIIGPLVDPGQVEGSEPDGEDVDRSRAKRTRRDSAELLPDNQTGSN